MSIGDLLKFAFLTAIGVMLMKLFSIPVYIVIAAFVLSVYLVIQYLKGQVYRRRAEVMLYFALGWAIIAFPYVLPYIPFFTGIIAVMIAMAITFLIVITSLLIIGNKIRD